MADQIGTTTSEGQRCLKQLVGVYLIQQRERQRRVGEKKHKKGWQDWLSSILPVQFPQERGFPYVQAFGICTIGLSTICCHFPLKVHLKKLHSQLF